jgi:hypothetical protein
MPVPLRSQEDPPTVDPEAARDAARDILSRAEYAEPEPSVVERAAEWVLDRVGSFIGTLTGGGPGSVIGWAIVAVFVAGATWLIVRSLRVPTTQLAPAADGVWLDTAERRDAAAWLEEAGRAEARGDLRGALRCRHQALIAVMVSRRLTDDVPGLTAREHQQHLTARFPDLGPEIAELTERFERTWYGGEPVSAAALRRFSEQCASIVDSMPEPTPAGVSA